MNYKLLNLYMEDVQVISKTKFALAKRNKWLDKTISILFAVSITALILKIAGEALAEAWIK